MVRADQDRENAQCDTPAASTVEISSQYFSSYTNWQTTWGEFWTESGIAFAPGSVVRLKPLGIPGYLINGLECKIIGYLAEK